MSNKAERQLKELRRLMPWNWDSKVEEHPPGEKAMHDFEDVLAYNLDRRRRANRPPSPAKPAKQQALGDGADNNKGPARRPKLTPVLSPKTENVKMPSSTGGAHPGKVNSEDRQDHSLPKSTARHPAPPAGNAAVSNRANETSTEAPLGSPDSIVAGTSAVATAPTAVAAPATAAGTATATAGRPYVTPANRRKAIQTPSSRPSTSRNHAALADGQFQPTPLPQGSTPATVIANAHAKGTNNNNGNFRSPQPRTVFGNKKRAATSMEESKIGGGGITTNTTSIARLATTSPVAHRGPAAATAAAKVASVGRTNKKQHVSREPMEPLSLNLNQCGRGPVITRPDSCPPLFKTSASVGVLGKRPPLPPLPAPSAQKTSQAAALSGQFFSQEKGLLAFISDKQQQKQSKNAQHPALVARPPMPLVVPAFSGVGGGPLVSERPPVAPATSAPAVGSALGWAFSQLREKQDQ